MRGRPISLALRPPLIRNTAGYLLRRSVRLAIPFYDQSSVCEKNRRYRRVLCRRSGSLRRPYASGASGESRDDPNLADRRSLSLGSCGRFANTQRVAPCSKVEFFAVVSRSNNFQRVTLFARCDRVSVVWRNHPARRAGNVGGLVCSLPETQRNLIVTGAARISNGEYRPSGHVRGLGSTSVSKMMARVSALQGLSGFSLILPVFSVRCRQLKDFLIFSARFFLFPHPI